MGVRQVKKGRAKSCGRNTLSANATSALSGFHFRPTCSGHVIVFGSPPHYIFKQERPSFLLRMFYIRLLYAANINTGPPRGLDNEISIPVNSAAIL